MVEVFGLTVQPGSGIKYEFEIQEVLKVKGAGIGLNSHHVGQKAVLCKFIPGYDLEKAPAILVPKQGHTIKDPTTNTVVSRIIKGINCARDLLARDIKELKRVYPDIPNSKLEELIELNKEMYPKAF